MSHKFYCACAYNHSNEISEDGHVDTPGNIHYPRLGRPCPTCKKVFVTCDSDLAGHLTVCKGSGLNSLDWSARARYKGVYSIPIPPISLPYTDLILLPVCLYAESCILP